MERTTDLFYPRRCPVCDRPVKPTGALICDDCRDAFERIEGPVCRICGRPVDSQNRERICPECRETGHSFTRGTAVFTYRSIALSIYRFKYFGREEYAAWYGGEMALRMERELHPPRDTLLVPVPIAKERMQERGYNQAALLAREIGKRTGLSVCENGLVRTTETRAQKFLDLAGRRKNVSHAFLAYENVVESRLIMLIDDIYTTGATMENCARALLLAGAQQVWFTVLSTGDAGIGYDQRTAGQNDDQIGSI